MIEEDVLQRQMEEVDALRAIYGDAAVSTLDGGDAGVTTVTVRLGGCSRLRVHLTPSYPAEMPVYELLSWSPPSGLHEALTELHEQQQGEVVLFQWVEHLRGLMEPEEPPAVSDLDPVTCAFCDVVSSEEATASSSTTDITECSSNVRGNIRKDELLGEIEVVHGEPFTDRKSTFQAHVAKVNSEEEAMRVLAWLKLDRKIARATHNMWAFRVFDVNKSAQVNDNDDDGEDAAGGKLAELLHLIPCVNDVMVVVSRWYGGIMLGPDRFRHINNVARQLLEQCGFQRKNDRGKQKRPSKK